MKAFKRVALLVMTGGFLFGGCFAIIGEAFLTGLAVSLISQIFPVGVTQVN